MPFSDELLVGVTEKIKSSVHDMAEYLVGGDIVQNLAVPREEWDMVAEPQICRNCAFYELCKPELGSSVEL